MTITQQEMFGEDDKMNIDPTRLKSQTAME